MSSNNLNNKKPFIYCEENNCDFNINNQTNLDYDNCQKLFKDKQSESPGIYNLNRYNDTTCGIPTVMEVAAQTLLLILRTVMELPNVILTMILN